MEIIDIVSKDTLNNSSIHRWWTCSM